MAVQWLPKAQQAGRVLQQALTDRPATLPCLSSQMVLLASRRVAEAAWAQTGVQSKAHMRTERHTRVQPARLRPASANSTTWLSMRPHCAGLQQWFWREQRARWPLAPDQLCWWSGPKNMERGLICE